MNPKGISYIIWILKLTGVCLLMPFCQTFHKWLTGESFTEKPQLAISINLSMLGIMLLLFAYCFTIGSYKQTPKSKKQKIRGKKDD